MDVYVIGVVVARDPGRHVQAADNLHRFSEHLVGGENLEGAFPDLVEEQCVGIGVNRKDDYGESGRLI